MFMFEDIVGLDDRAIQVVLRKVDSKDLAVALKGVREDVREKITRNMSERAALALADEIGILGPVRLKQVEEAQAVVIRQIRTLEEAGEIIVSRGGTRRVRCLAVGRRAATCCGTATHSRRSARRACPRTWRTATVRRARRRRSRASSTRTWRRSSSRPRWRRGRAGFGLGTPPGYEAGRQEGLALLARSSAASWRSGTSVDRGASQGPPGRPDGQRPRGGRPMRSVVHTRHPARPLRPDRDDVGRARRGARRPPPGDRRPRREGRPRARDGPRAPRRPRHGAPATRRTASGPRLRDGRLRMGRDLLRA